MVFGFGRAAPLALGALWVLVHPAIARGDDRAGRKEEGEEQRAPHDWTLAAGVGFAGFGSAVGIGAVGGLSPLLALMVERRLSKHLWLMGRASGTYGRSEDNLSGVGGVGVTPIETRTVQGGGALGVRWVFNPGRMTELSTFTTAGLSHSRSEQEPSKPVEGVGVLGFASRSTSLQGQLGASVDRELTQGLGVRLSLVVAQVGWSTSEGAGVINGAPTELESQGFTAAVTLSPTLEMRFSF